MNLDFAQIFTEMSWVSASLLFVGLIFLVVEVLLPGFGFFGISGGLCLIAGVIVRICEGLSVEQSLVLILMIIGLGVVALMFMVFSAQYGILGKTGIFETKSTLSSSYNTPVRELRKLVGKSGKAVSNLNLGGKAKINGKIYEVVSINSYIEQGQHVKVVAIQDNTIMVRKWFE